MFGDATTPDSGFNRIIGEEKIRERERRKREGWSRRQGRTLGRGRGKRSLLVIAAPSLSRMHYL